ncbi:hypothetical protein DACRYDRAFT_24804 [Dacryopinax primogenitus]|uniref:Uncharacterized protein n=1 Tax=Dacryopinax primogenitus (strain DJM 731) TaxID=1858805 RepID=M5FWP5_DACPD|nr:uncharacterized protein DACRYDRAFT_24804 [Dacryopinax primogenitus]EJT97856.1 hypothetical protein DACRYDRAFT_24804 [Dacryopinax primogenitus]
MNDTTNVQRSHQLRHPLSSPRRVQAPPLATHSPRFLLPPLPTLPPPPPSSPTTASLITHSFLSYIFSFPSPTPPHSPMPSYCILSTEHAPASFALKRLVRMRQKVSAEIRCAGGADRA